MASVKKTVTFLFFALALGFLCSLGAWQMQRAHDKEQMLSLIQNPGKNHKPEFLNSAPEDWENFQYRNLQLTGDWIVDKDILMDNRIKQGVVGYEVYTPFRLRGDQSLLLVNRGWIPKEKTLSPANPETPSHAIGTLYLPKKGYTLGTAMTDTSAHWPKVSLYFDPAAFSKVLSETVAPAMLVLNAEHSMSFERIWEPVVVKPVRHYAYAVQWFGLAITLLIFGIIWVRPKK